MNPERLLIGAIAALLTAGCAGRTGDPVPVPAAPVPAPAPDPEPLPQVVWTVRPEVAVNAGDRAIAVRDPFTRLDVEGRDSLGLRVTCAYCENPVAGWVREADVLADPQSPATAAEGTLVEFALAVRNAAAWREVPSLVPVMTSDFTFGFSAQRDRAAALTVWGWEGFRNLDQLPRLLDAGLVEIGPDFWVAPREYATTPGFQGLRTGFRRNAETGTWEWLFLVRGEQ